MLPKELAVKHRACDECRARKLACSKDPNGCERCNRENIICHYSEQKPMGRPRKRQFIEAMQETNDQSNDAAGFEVPFVADEFNNYEHNEFAEPYFTDMNNQSPTGLLPPDPTRASKMDNGRVVWHFGDREIMAGPPIHFGDILDIAGLEESNIEPPPPLSGASTVTESENSPSQPASDGPCSCLASMYLALSSLQQLPKEIVPALKAVRSAAGVAASTIWCPKCGSVCIENPNPPIEAFQNTMLLGTILPIIANGYQRLLKMVDDETELATTMGQTKTFQFHDYGGMCGKNLTIEQSMTCIEKELFFNAVEMPPDQWRATVRAMLRVDIYGHEQEGFKHKGLKDLVSEMELRQRARHALVDAHIAAGNVPVGTMQYGALGQKLCLGEQTHGCLQILAMAKLAIDNLIIA